MAANKARPLKATEKSRTPPLLRLQRTQQRNLGHKRKSRRQSHKRTRRPRARRRTPLPALRNLEIRATTTTREARTRHQNSRTLVHRNQKPKIRLPSILHRAGTHSHKRANARQLLRRTQRANGRLVHPQAQRRTRTRLALRMRRQAPRTNKPRRRLVANQTMDKPTLGRMHNHRNWTSHRRARSKTQPRRRMTTQKHSPSLATRLRTADLLRRVLVHLPRCNRRVVGAQTPLALKRLGGHQRTRHQNNRTRRSRIQRTRLKHRSKRTQTRHIHRHQL